MSNSTRARVAISRADHLSGSPGNSSPETLDHVYRLVKTAVDHIGGIQQIIDPGDKVIIKVNAGVAAHPDKGFTTDPRILEAVIKLIKNEAEPASINVVERTASCGCTEEALITSGLREAAMKAGADGVINLEKAARCPVQCPDPLVLFEPVSIPECIQQADKIIYLPKMKTHKLTDVSLSMKLSQGILGWSDIHRNHRADVEQKMVDMLKIVKPDLVIVDALWPMQGQGPVSPYPEDLVKDFNVVLAGRDAVAVDAVASMVMGFDPLHEINTVRTADALGLGIGNPSMIDILGVPLEKVMKNFRRGNLDLSGLHPKIKVYYGSACKGCVHLTRTGLDPWLADPGKRDILDRMDQLTFIMGPRTRVPADLNHNPPNSYVFVVGDCASAHRDRGIFLPGCASWSIARMDFVGKQENELVEWYFSRYPGIEKDENDKNFIP